MIWPNSRLPSRMPVALSLSSTAMYWNTPVSASSSSTMAVAARTVASRSSVTSPTIRVASAGPGKGMRWVISGGRPSSLATSRTPSLRSVSSGSSTR